MSASRLRRFIPVWLSALLIVLCSLFDLQIRAGDRLSVKDIDKISNKGIDLFNAKRYPEALTLFQQAHDAAMQTLKPDDGRMASVDRNLGLALYNLDRYEEAWPYLKEALSITEKNQGTRSSFLAAILFDTMMVLEHQNKLQEAEDLARRRVDVLQHTKGANDSETLIATDHVGDLLRWQGKWDSSRKTYEEAFAIRQSLEDNDGKATSLVNLGRLEDDQLHYQEAVALYEKALAIDLQNHGPVHASIVRDLRGLGFAYGNEGQWRKSLETCSRYVDLYAKVYPNNTEALAYEVIAVGNIARQQGEFSQATSLFVRAIQLAGASSNTTVQQYVLEAKKGMAGAFLSQGRYREAADLYEQLYPAYARNPIDALAILNNEGLALAFLGRYSTAQELLNKALRESDAVSPEWLVVPANRNAIYGLRSTIVLNLAGVAQYLGAAAQSETLFAKALEMEKVAQVDAGARTQTMLILVDHYLVNGQLEKAEALVAEAVPLAKESYGADSYRYARVLNTAAEAARLQRKYDQAEQLYQQSIKLLETTAAPGDPETGRATEGYALLKADQGHPELADSLFQRSISNVQHEFNYLFEGMSERDRLQFLKRMQDRFDEYYSFVIRNSRAGEIPAHAYDLVLWQKALVVSGLASIRSNLSSSSDAEAQMLWSELREKRAQIAGLYSLHPDIMRTDFTERIAALETEANRLERNLATKFPSVGSDKSLGLPTWIDVRARLRPADAAVEFVRFRYHDGRSWKEESKYMALVVLPGGAAPSIVDFGDSSILERAVTTGYRSLVQNPETARGLELSPAGSQSDAESLAPYLALWEPLQDKLGVAKRVFLSPDGILDTISYAAICVSESKKILDLWDVRIVNSTRDLLRVHRTASARTAVLIGDPDFDADLSTSQNPSLTTSLVTEPTVSMRSRNASGIRLPPLPGTRKEVTSLQELLKAHNWQVELHSGSDAREEIVKGVHGPQVLHIATHGFFFPSERTARPDSAAWWEDPMLRSGLLLAGANRTLSGNSPHAMDDGVLTALEAAGIDLQGTDLVVLSACGTGLGENEAGEGVFGLRRSIEIAGASSVMMSMWSVPDRETQELMSLFYENWLNGMEKSSALLQAQAQIRERVKQRYGRDLPYFWAAFVLVGG